MKINGNAIRPGNVIEHKGHLWRAVKIQHTQPGKGGAYLQVELKDIRDGTKLNERFRASEDVDKVRLDQRQYQFLYGELDGSLTFMDQETYDQVSLNSDRLNAPAEYLQDGMVVTIESYEGDVIGVSLPETVVMKVTEADPVVKGLLQARGAGERPQDHGAAAHRGRHGGRGQHGRGNLRRAGQGLT
jgi:elongation factor P